MNRAERRRHERDRRRGRPIIIGDGIVATSLGEHFDASVQTFAKLPDKQPGKHRWMAAASFVLDMPDRLIADANTTKMLDAQHLMYLGVGCWDCERAFQDVVDLPCEAEAADDP